MTIPVDVDLAREALSDGKIVNNLSVAQDGIEALAFLRKESAIRERSASGHHPA